MPLIATTPIRFLDDDGVKRTIPIGKVVPDHLDEDGSLARNRHVRRVDAEPFDPAGEDNRPYGGGTIGGRKPKAGKAKAAADTAGAGQDNADLDSVDDAQLAEIANGEAVEIPEGSDRAAIITLIQTKRAEAKAA